MYPRPPGLNRPAFDCASFNLGEHLRCLFDSVGYELTDRSKVGEPGEYHGSARSGGDTYGFALSYFGREVMSKFDDEKSESDEAKTKVATEKFLEAEKLCAATNRKFHKYLLGHRPADEQVARVLLRAREKIGRLMENVDWSRVLAGCTFTSGSSVLLKRGRSTPIHKYSSKLESTEQSLSLVSQIFSGVPSLGVSLTDSAGINVVPGNKLTCVPKSYKTHRVIASEPSGTMYAQKGLHKEIRRRLRAVGVDLSDQTQNQDWARLGSASGLVATVDMSMASDTVSYNVVEWMYSLVPDVFDYLDRCRSTKGKLADRAVTYEKFSSMGNALTFEVETSIFWAIAVACCEVSKADSRFVSIYGDDIIVPNRVVELLFKALSECGFVPNEKKTFFETNPHALANRFRESCGKHYYRGEDVSPVYIRKQPKSLLDYFHLVNNTVRWLKRLEGISDAPPLKEAWKYIRYLRSLAPEQWRKPRIPDGYGDGAFIGTFDECTPSTKMSKNSLWFEGYRVEVLTERFDKAVGRSNCGRALVRRTVRHKSGTQLTIVDSKEEMKVVGPVTFRGFALASLEKMEKGQSKVMIRNTSRFRDLRTLARGLSIVELANEGMSLELLSTRQVVTSLMVLPKTVEW